MDRQKLRNLVFEKTGLKVDSDDPIFALVALNEAVLGEMMERQLALLDQATHAPARHHPAPPPHAGPAAAVTPAMARPIPTQAEPLLAPREKRLLAAAAGVAVLSALLVLGGQALLARPAAPALTAAQSAALAEADKLRRAVQQLPADSRRLLDAEMAKP